MLIELARDEAYRGKEYKKGEVIEVGDALGERLVLSGHKRVFEIQKKNIGTDNLFLTDEEIDVLPYKECEALIKQFGIETKNRKHDTYRTALKEYFNGQREQ